MTARTRLAPSPTGEPHIGNFYTALLNYGFAKKSRGQFIVRIEDTDRTRFVPGAEEKIYAALDWLGITEDESPRQGGPFEPYQQSERLEIYQKYAAKLVELGAAYEDSGAVRQKIPRAGETNFTDAVRGQVVFKNQNLNESVLLKSDGYPTYHLAVVVDDHLMQISHVIRAEEWLSSTPKHVLLFKALGWQPPEFVHLPLLRNPDQSKLSKRKNPTAVLWYRDQGFLPEAVKNYLTHLGWTHPQQEDIYSFDEFLRLFELKDLKPTAPIFDLEKLKWMNGVYIRHLSVDELSSKLFAQGGSTTGGKARMSKLMENTAGEDLKKIVNLVQCRIKALGEFEKMAGFFFKEPQLSAKALIQKARTSDETRRILSTINNQLLAINNSNWQAGRLEQLIRGLMEQNPNWSTKDLFMTLRVAVSGQTVSPPLFESLEILGPKTTRKRLKQAIRLLENAQGQAQTA